MVGRGLIWWLSSPVKFNISIRARVYVRAGRLAGYGFPSRTPAPCCDRAGSKGPDYRRTTGLGLCAVYGIFFILGVAAFADRVYLVSMKVYEAITLLYIIRDSYGNIVYVTSNADEAEANCQWNEWVVAQEITVPIPTMED